MEMDLIQTILILVLAAIFGLVARNLTKDEKAIYKQKRYFPTFKVLLILASIFSLFLNKNFSIFLISVLIMLIFWDHENPWERKSK